jgi:diguanylate cyclase (GGDEF)-like protein
MTAMRQATARALPLVTFAACGISGFVIGAGQTAPTSAFVMDRSQLAAFLVFAVILVVAGAWMIARTRRIAGDAAVRDAITGLYDRAYVEDWVPRLMARDDRAGHSQLALIVLRIDLLDQIERRYGAAVTAQALRLVGRKICSQIRTGDIPARLDARTLGVFLQCDEAEQAVAFGRRLGMLLGAEQLDWRGDVIKVSASMGVAVRATNESLDALYARAADRLRQASDSGSGQIRV